MNNNTTSHERRRVRRQNRGSQNAPVEFDHIRARQNETFFRKVRFMEEGNDTEIPSIWISEQGIKSMSDGYLPIDLLKPQYNLTEIELLRKLCTAMRYHFVNCSGKRSEKGNDRAYLMEFAPVNIIAMLLGDRYRNIKFEHPWGFLIDPPPHYRTEREDECDNE